jgi:hypothetical protein
MQVKEEGPNKRSCFVIMPFSETTPKHTKEYWTNHYLDFLKPLIEQRGNLIVHRSEELRADIITQIVTDLVKSDVVVADLTDTNANVMWELGIRQSFKSGTVTVVDKDTKDKKLPFDVYSKSTITYDLNDSKTMDEFREKFPRAIQDCFDNERKCDSRVLEVIGMRGTLYEIVRREEIIRRLDAVDFECVHNRSLLLAIAQAAERNLRKGAQPSVIMHRFGVSAIESLVVNRYIEKDKRFFESAYLCMSLALAFNSELDRWQGTRKHLTENWLLRNRGDMDKALTDLQANVLEVRSMVIKRV